MGFENAPKEVLIRAAESVKAVLEAAGIPCMFGELPQENEVAQIAVDLSPGDSGISVSWELSRAENHLVNALAAAGNFSDPAIAASGTRREVGMSRVEAALVSAGIEVVNPENDFDPYMLEIVSVPG